MMDGEMPSAPQPLPDLTGLNISARSPAPIEVENKTEEELTAEIQTEDAVAAMKVQKKRAQDEKRMAKRQARQGVKVARPVANGPMTERTLQNIARLRMIQGKREEVLKQREEADEKLEERRKAESDELKQEQAKLAEALRELEQ